MTSPNSNRNDFFRLTWASTLCAAGLTLLFTALWLPPQGEIDPSVLVAYGEVMTFVGGLVGIDYVYRNKPKQ